LDKFKILGGDGQYVRTEELNSPQRHYLRLLPNPASREQLQFTIRTSIIFIYHLVLTYSEIIVIKIAAHV